MAEKEENKNMAQKNLLLLKHKKADRIFNDQSKRLMTIRGLFKFKKTNPIDISEVESEESIIHRFACSAMSMGAISTEAHTTMAIAIYTLLDKKNLPSENKKWKQLDKRQ